MFYFIDTNIVYPNHLQTKYVEQKKKSQSGRIKKWQN